uniref:ATP synthase F0 subunit 8 n=1 Tax=Colpocephalum eucarenum TaxID=2965266 RepID=UPI0026E2491A|nr:ATP synthase F0 subunit 8 [Colpocephalum eucarenum]WIM51516.1 ATP synthase subunit 8 [Colpocephalum eucarenum]
MPQMFPSSFSLLYLIFFFSFFFFYCSIFWQQSKFNFKKTVLESTLVKKPKINW